MQHLGPVQRKQAFKAALDAASSIEDDYYRAMTLRELASQLGPEQAGQAFTAALEATLVLPEGSEREEALGKLAPWLGAEQVGQAFTAALALRAESMRVAALTALAPHLSPEQAGQSLESARYNHHLGVQSSLLSVLRHQFSDDVLRLSLLRTRSSSNVLVLNNKDLELALSAARAIQDEGAEVRAVVNAVRRLSFGERARAFSTILPLNRLTSIAWLTRLSRNETSSREVLLEPDRRTVNEDEQDDIATIEMTIEQAAEANIEDALETIMSLQDDLAKSWLIAKVARDLSGRNLALALDLIMNMSDETSQGIALSALAGRLDDTGCWRVLSIAKSAGRLQALILAALADSRMSSAHVKAAVSLILDISDEAGRALAFAVLVPHLRGSERTRMLDEIDGMTEDEHRCWVNLSIMCIEEGIIGDSVAILAEQLAEMELKSLPVLDLGFAVEWLKFLAHLMPIASAQPDLLTYIRRRTVDVLSCLGDWSRRDVLTLLGLDHVLTPPVVSPEWDSVMLSSILSVCHSWNWL